VFCLWPQFQIWHDAKEIERLKITFTIIISSWSNITIFQSICDIFFLCDLLHIYFGFVQILFLFPKRPLFCWGTNESSVSSYNLNFWWNFFKLFQTYKSKLAFCEYDFYFNRCLGKKFMPPLHPKLKMKFNRHLGKKTIYNQIIKICFS